MAAEAFEIQGEWWLPEAAARTVSGTLKFDPESGAELLLMKSLRSVLDEGDRTVRDGTVTISHSMQSMAKAGTYPRIHGESNGYEFTLEDCFRLHGPLLFDGPESIHVNSILKGVQVPAGEAASGNGVSVGLRYLTYWVSGPHIREEWRRPEGEGRMNSFVLDAEDLPDEQVILDSGAVVVLNHRVGVTGDGIRERVLWQRYGLRVNVPELQPIEDLMDRVGDLQGLISIATGRTAEFDGLGFWHPDVTDRGRPDLIEYFARWNARDAGSGPERLHQHEMFFSYPEFGGIEGVGRWMNTAAVHSAALGRVIASRFTRQMFVSDRLLNRTAALEAFDRVEHPTRESFRDRMARCAALAGQPFERLVGDLDTWLDVIRDDRDDVAHHLGRRSRDDASEQYFLAESVYWLFALCMLRDCSAPEAVFTRIKDHQHMTWLAPQVGAAVGRWKAQGD